METETIKIQYFATDSRVTPEGAESEFSAYNEEVMDTKEEAIEAWRMHGWKAEDEPAIWLVINGELQWKLGK